MRGCGRHSISLLSYFTLLSDGFTLERHPARMVLPGVCSVISFEQMREADYLPHFAEMRK